MYKFNRYFIFFSLLISFYSNAAEIGPLEKDSQNNTLRLNQVESMEYCKNKSSRLPSAREYAELSMKQGATGILETAFPTTHYFKPEVQNEVQINKKKPESYSPIVLNLNNDLNHPVVGFYYSYAHFIPANDDSFAEYSLRTESSKSFYGESPNFILYEPKTGRLLVDYASQEYYEPLAFRCIK